LVAVVVAAMVFYAIGAATGTPSSNGRQTWSQFGMSIQYPSGVQVHYVGVLNQQADSSSGEAEWLWNGANTGLLVLWVTTPTYNITAGLRAIQSGLLSSASNVEQTGQGNLTIASHFWRYLTLSFTTNGVNGYATFAGTYYAGSGRAYFLAYFGTSSDTVQNLQTYGGTFSG
jgi:hypothetical protein